jgi:hypothetical protein
MHINNLKGDKSGMFAPKTPIGPRFYNSVKVARCIEQRRWVKNIRRVSRTYASPGEKESEVLG